MTSILILSLCLLALLVIASTGYAKDCGTSPTLCKTSLGEYAIRLPKTRSEKPVPAMIYFHGAGGSGPRAMKNTKMVNAFLARGYAVIAPSGLKRPNSNFGPGWSFLPFRPQQRDELAFAKEVLEDAAKHHNIDRDTILLTGFSIGGSMTWYLACRDPKLAKAFAPVAGAFWRPHPKSEDCKGTVNLFHTHGWRDGTVPLEGRPLRGGAIIQGDVFESLRIMRKVNGCNQLRADKFNTKGRYWRRQWTKCLPNSALELALHTGGHKVPTDWADMALDWFERLPVGD